MLELYLQSPLRHPGVVIKHIWVQAEVIKPVRNKEAHLNIIQAGAHYYVFFFTKL
jgi:hypothetical protein